ncbi:MAG: RagB/SusD family nutrient uptake outer membrane protein [Bacteroidaceae bacterium]|nr:RagB/SusD family nutrient uptake outer membrane protein [Bacteroidaceae bacterium]
MKKFKYPILTLALGALALTTTSCIDEVTPTTVATEEMVNESAAMQEGLLYGINSAMIATSTDNHFRFGYSSLMHVRDVMTGDMAIDQESQYDQYWSWEQNSYNGRDYTRAGYIWSYYYTGIINAANNVVGGVNPATASEEGLGILGVGLAARALAYLDLAQMYEVKANDILPEVDGKIINAKGNDIKGLTVPIVTDEATEEQAHSNPRATREEMFAFIENDLLNAEQYITHFTTSDKTFPHLDAVYGLQARLYLWHGDYDKAYTAAVNAINNSSVVPISEERGLSKTNGFNTSSDFMWAGQFAKENRAVTSGIANWTSMMSNETTYGYAGGGACWVQIDASMYSRISETDWRKKWFKAPKGSALESQVPFIDDEWAEDMPVYSSVKFRPGQGEMQDYTVASSVAFPIMRVEEMYFIAAEAAARTQGPAAGLAALTDFMQTYRDPDYSSDASSLEDVIDEIIFQKRVELWGEGLTMFDIKRLNMPVTRGYEGSNFDPDYQYNTTTFPGWMNFVLPRSEENNNPAAADFATPDPSDKYLPWGFEEEDETRAAAPRRAGHKVLKLK